MHTKIRAQIGVSLAVLALVLSGAPASQANLTGSSFDAGDGNLVVNDEAKDWANIGINCTSTPTVGCGIDLPTGQGDNSFGNGTKEDDPVPTVTNGSIPNNKSDLLRFYTSLTAENGDDFLYLAWERVQEPNGTTNMDFEFNQSKVTSANGVTPVRTAGDILVKYDLSQGGVNPDLGYHEWITAGNPRADCEASNSLPCWGTVNPLTGFFEGSINTVEVVDPIAPDAGRQLSVRTFGEAAINLTDSGIIPANTCLPFASAYLKSRSSDSFTSAVKDFIAPISAGASRCGTINITKVNDDSPVSALQGAVFTLYNDASPVGTALGTEDTAVTPATTCTTSAAGTCSFTNVPIGNYWVVETTTPTGHDTAAPQQAVISAGGTVALTFVNPRDFKVIVLVCSEATNSLYPSQVTLDGSAAKTSLGTPPSGVTAAQLCGLGGAAFDDQSYGGHTAGVTIPQ